MAQNILSRRSEFVRGFQGKDCGVPVLTGHYWLQTVPEAHAVIALDISDPEHPREVSKLMVGEDEQPHWMSIDPTGRHVVLNSSGGGKGNRLFLSTSIRAPASSRWTSGSATRAAHGLASR